MDATFKKDTLALSKLLNMILVFALLAMIVVSVILGVGLTFAIQQKSRTLVPPTISKSFTVSDSHVDGAYLSMMADYFLYLKLNVTPANVSRQYGKLLDYVPPKQWPQIQPLLAKEAQTIQDGNIASHFDPLPEGTEVSVERLQVKQRGHVTKSVGDRTLPTEAITYLVQMGYDNGVIELIGITKETTVK
ncbi:MULTISPECIES: type IV conjugative transfer system protein TraE [Vibrio]|uniref:Type IV conjugative transfer system protein TraE n=1 Tax=Vibrio mediterranei TaxID=689 RepID=A0ABX5D7C8_9VIBR|nr:MULTISPECIES: type IV conjugative transfer system protein TraE [Vibrio]KFA94992.1 conjugal transfer protein TraE [Vibrio sp. ER1A]PCD85526.1 type IV conjugative transfer system protein TraE [Vibrio mediterranei]PRQ65385.1 type IV conjugative transfer system protein TraE [Vibrio mediterranei]